jgi:hypothetical protein
VDGGAVEPAAGCLSERDHAILLPQVLVEHSQLTSPTTVSVPIAAICVHFVSLSVTKRAEIAKLADG